MTSSLAKPSATRRMHQILEETKIDGGDIMPTLAQRWKDEGKRNG